MTIVIEDDGTDSATVEEIVEYMNENRIDVTDHSSFMMAAPMLKRLSNNRSFLTDMVAAELGNYDNLQQNNLYGGQSIIVYKSAGKQSNFFIRANLWPSRGDGVMQNAGAHDQFAYSKPHDHNFNFLTVGYLGPGYWSNYYTYDCESTLGIQGETADLKFVEKTALSRGKIMLYRASIDIHDQIPPESFSVSLNIMEATPWPPLVDQAEFDMRDNSFKRFLNRSGAHALFDVMALFGTEEDRAMLEDIGLRHLSNRIRCCAWKSLSNSSRSAEAAVSVLSKVPLNAPQELREWTRQRIRNLESTKENMSKL